MNKFIKDEKEMADKNSEADVMMKEKKIVRGGQVFTDQFYTQHMRFYKGVSIFHFYTF